jgi:hypothetical protein
MNLAIVGRCKGRQLARRAQQLTLERLLVQPRYGQPGMLGDDAFGQAKGGRYLLVRQLCLQR